VSCRLLTRSHLASGDSDHIPPGPPLPGTVPAALVPSRGQTALHHPAPSWVRAGHGPPGHLSTRSTGGPLGSGQLGSVLRSHPCSAQATRITGRTHGSGRLGSQRPVTSHDADHGNTAGTGVNPARARAFPSGTSPIVQKSQAEDPAGNRRRSSRLLRQGLRWSTSQALRSADPGAQLHRA
jgi:hypothetical protein